MDESWAFAANSLIVMHMILKVVRLLLESVRYGLSNERVLVALLVCSGFFIVVAVMKLRSQ